jgi:exodeoxyribonuclease V alpha subunit
VVRGRTGKTLAPSQRETLKTVLANRVVVITGGPGVGKTTLVNSIGGRLFESDAEGSLL